MEIRIGDDPQSEQIPTDLQPLFLIFERVAVVLGEVLQVDAVDGVDYGHDQYEQLQ